MDTRVLIAGIAGASLGTELVKCLHAAGGYVAYGCDISPYAYEHYRGFAETFIVDRDDYVASVVAGCARRDIRLVVPGADEPNVLLSGARDQLARSGIHLASNAPELVARFSDKAATFAALGAAGFCISRTVTASDASSLRDMTFPCIVKPSTGTGGSSLVFIAEDADEARLCVQYVTKSGRTALLQEYLPDDEAEFTVGVLSYPDGEIASSIALRRLLENKLSVSHRGKAGVISSGYSQGLIDAFPEVCAQAERIATSIGSTGPLNVQGRLKDGEFIAFEINPRFSASAYLRAMAGINELDTYLRALTLRERRPRGQIRPGYYLRGLDEIFVGRQDVKQR